MHGPIPRVAPLLATISLLSGCGGGAAGVDGGWLTFTPNRIAVTALQGEPTPFTVVARATRTFEQTVNVGIVDGLGRIGPAVSLTTDGAGTYTAALTTASLPGGRFQGSLEVRVCFDDPRVCARPAPGSPWLVPYTFTVTPFDQPPLQAVAGLQGWSTSGGNATHLARLPITLTPSSFSRRWWAKGGDGPNGPVDALAADGGRVFVQSTPWLQPTLFSAFSEDDGTPLWTHDTGLAKDMYGVQVTGPAAAHGQVYFAHLKNGMVWALDQATGAQRWAVQLPAGQTFNTPPTPYGDSVFLSHGSCYFRLAALDGATVWTLCPAGGIAAAPYIRDDLLYRAGSGSIEALRITDGMLAWSVAVENLSGSRAVALAGRMVCTTDGLACVDSTSQAVTGYVGGPARRIIGATEAVVFEQEVQSPETLFARDAATAAPLWSLGRFFGMRDTLVVADGSLLLGGDIIDAATRQRVLPALPGKLRAVSASGTAFYLDSYSGLGDRLIAVNLR